jgi:hypothetical protein
MAVGALLIAAGALLALALPRDAGRSDSGERDAS